MRIELSRVALVGAVAALMACTGGGSPQVAGIDRGGAQGGIAVGVVTGLGSIFVNDVRYETSTATIMIDGVAASEADFRLGQVATVQADLSGAVATALTVAVDSLVIGPVADLDPVNGTFIALGQNVRVTATTYFADNLEPLGLDALNNGDIIRINGLVDANDEISATRIERLAAVAQFELQGIARNVNQGLQSFMIGGLIVDYSSASLIDGFPSGQPEEGDLVRVGGNQFGGSGEFVVDRIALRANDLADNEEDEAEIEGFITSFTSATDFQLAGIPVTTDGATEFEGGTAGDLALNVRVEVEGVIGAGGVLLADKVEFKPDGNIRMEADVSAVDVAAGTLTVLGVTVHADGLTDLGLITVGDCAKVRGYESTQDPGALIATRLEREDSCGDKLLRGVVESVADPDFTIFGITVMTDGSTSFPGGSAAAFFAAATGRLVEAKGDQVGNSLLAEEIEFKD